MKNMASNWSGWLRGLILACLSGMSCAHAADTNDSGWQSFIGKNEWLFLKGEFTDASDLSATNASIDLVRRLNKVLEHNGVALVFVMVPLKARVYEQYLPEDVRLNSYTKSNYERMMAELRAGGVNAIDLNTPFLNTPQKPGDTPLFFRFDTHWTHKGSMLAAETIRDGIESNPALNKALEATPEVKYEVVWSKHKVNATPGDLIKLLPDGSPVFEAEQVEPFVLSGNGATGNTLLGEDNAPRITLVGSSYSGPWYGFSDALRYTLQRDVLTSWVSAVQGSWVGMEMYLRDDSFQTRKPKILIWEIQSRGMNGPPDYKYRDARYHSDNTEWLLRAAAWVQSTCEPSTVKAKIVAGGLLANPADNVTAGKTTSQDFIELSFDKPIDKLDYLAANVATTGSKKMVLEASGAGEETRWIDVPVPGDGVEHLLKVPLPSHGKGFTKLRIFPGRSRTFTVNGLKVCRQPADLLQ